MRHLFVSEAPPKLCGKCRVVKPETDFNRAGSGRQHWCRECFRAYFKARGKVHLEQVARSKNQRRTARRAQISRSRASGCIDCGERDEDVLEFDHLDPVKKRRDVGQMWLDCAPPDVLERELSHCEVVCANCHRRRTAERGGWGRLLDKPPASAGRRPRAARNIRFVYDYLRAHPCVDCGEQDLVVLELDHVGPKRASVLALAWGEYGLDTLQWEIAQCEVRCANCHRKVTVARRRRDRHELAMPD